MSYLKLLFKRTAAMGVFLSAWASAQNNGAVISPLSSETKAAMMGKSWKPGCPVALDDLASVRVTYIDFDGYAREGKLIVHRRIADDVSKLFQELYSIRFPIHKAAAWENYGPDVYAQQNITVGFYCEKADDAPTEWSSHAYGMAIDINPLLNPFLDLHHQWWPKTAVQYVTRDSAQGKVSAQTEVFGIFTRHGWAWGGFDAGVPDYMHFNKVTIGDGAKMDRPYIVTGLQYIPNGATEAAQPKK
jgi:D-alanyl-D-alanine carboxypeptidase-like protein